MRITQMVDLSVPVSSATVVYPDDPAPRLTPHSTIERDGFNVLDVHIGSQTGTHVDAPFHFDADTPQLDALPLSHFLGTAVVIDASGVGPRAPVTWHHIAPVAERLGPGVVALIRTDWSAHYGQPSYFDNPYLEASACQWMLDLGVRTFCIDAINIDETPDHDHPGSGFATHHLIARAGGVIGENFTNLAHVTWPNPFVMCLPIALEGADGAPVRAVAVQFD